jgi:hypothetical protein
MNLLPPSEEAIKTWIRRKGILVQNRPKPSKFSFTVCLTIVFSIAFGFLGGFITASFALNESYSSVYESLLAELENARTFIEKEKRQLMNMDYNSKSTQINHATVRHNETNQPNRQVHEQAILNVFRHAIELLQKNDKVERSSSNR